MKADRDLVMQHLGPFLEGIESAVRRGAVEYLNRIGAPCVFLSRRAKVNSLVDFIGLELENEFAYVPDVKVLAFYGTKRFAFGDVVLRVKKVDPATFRTQNHPTQAALDFGNSSSLFGDETVLLNLGYQVDRFYSDVQRVFLTCPRKGSGARVHWVVELDKFKSAPSIFTSADHEIPTRVLKANTAKRSPNASTAG